MTGLGHGGDAEGDTLAGIENLTGSGFNDILEGDGGDGALTGLGGADVLIGGAGIDAASYAASAAGVDVSLVTGLGHGGDAEGDSLTGIENLTGSAFNDTLAGDAGNNLLTGGAGIDTVSYQSATAGVAVSLAVAVAQNTNGAGTDTLATFENLIGSAFDDTLIGSSLANVLTGLAGNDIFDGGGGADRMIGGTGNDTYAVDNAGDVVDETGGDGTDLVQSAVTFSLSDAVHAIGGIENLTLTLTGNINGTGTALANVITGNGGNNTLAGLGGADTLIGGAGIDTASYAASSAGVDVSLITGAGYNGDAEGDSLAGFENLTGSAFNDTLAGDAGNNLLIGGAGIDTASYQSATAGVTVSLVIAVAQNTLGAGIDTLATLENLIGSAYGDTLTGSSLANVLTGLGGNDSLNGGTGADTMRGGTGSDTYFVDSAGDVVDETGGNGTDLVQSAVTFNLSDAVHAIGAIENLTLTLTGNINGTGTGLANVITGNAGNNLLAGLGGADSLIGGAGIDTASYTASSAGVDVSLATGLGHDGDAEGDTLTGIENLTGSAFDDTLQGDAGSNLLTGGAGVDTVSYQNATAAVTVSLATTLAQNTFGAGIDTLASFENLTGSAFADTLTGSSSANVLDELAGNDSLNGGAGADTMSGGSGSDLFVFAKGFGNDAITDFEAGAAATDVIAIASTIFADFAAVLAHTADDASGDAVIALDAYNSITLNNVHKVDLNANDFLFTG